MCWGRNRSSQNANFEVGNKGVAEMKGMRAVEVVKR